MANEYVKTQWHTGDAITQEKMNHIEEGIEALNGTVSNVANLTTNINNMNQQIGTNTNAISTIQGQLDGITTEMQQGNASGAWAAAQIHAATDQRASDTQYATLDVRLVGMTNETMRIGGLVNAHSDNLNSAIRSTVPEDTLGKRFGDVERDTQTLAQGYTALRDDINAAGQGYNDVNNQPSLAVRLNNYGDRIEDLETEIAAANGNHTLNERFGAIETELNNAHISTAILTNNTNTAYNSLDERLEADEAMLVNLQTNKLNADSTGISDTLDDTYVNRALSANMGNTIKRMLGTGVGTTQGTTVVDMINSAQQSASNSANSYTDGLLGTGFDTTNTVAKAISDLESEAINTTNALDDRLDEIEDALDIAKTSSIVRTPGENEGDPDTDTTYASLDARLEAIESHAANVRSDVNTIADELNMVNTQTGAIQDTNSRVDTIEANVVAMAKEIGMLQDDDAVVDLSTAVSRTTTRVDNIEDEISAAHRANSGHFEEDIETHEQIEIEDTLDLRFDDVEENISTINDTLGSGFDTTTNTVSAKIIAVLNDAENYTDTKNSEYNVAEINAAHRINSGHFEEDEDTHEQVEVNDTLNLRFTDIEERLDNIDASETGRLDLLDNRLDAIDNAETGILNTLDERLDAIDGGNTLTGISLAQQVSTLDNDINAENMGLKAKITTLEGKDTVIINDALFNEGIPQIQNPSTNCDYLIKNNDDNKYYYWRYFGQETGWQLISGAGGGGTGSSSGEFAASLDSITNPDENTDYFVGNNTIGYTHYRYVPSIEENVDGTFVRILPNGLIVNASVTANGGLEAYTIENANDNVFSDFVAFKDVEATPVKDENEQVVATDLVFTNTNGQTVTARVQGGGGGGVVSSYTMRLNNTLASLKLTVPKKDGYIAYVKSKVVVKDAGVIDETFDQSHTINIAIQYSNSKNGPWTNFTTLTALNNTEFSVDVTRILSLGQTTYVRVEASTLIDEETKTSSLIYEVTQVEMSIAAVNFNQAIVRTTNFNFQYRCMGSGLTKQVHFLIDGTDITGSPITTTLHNDIGQQNIPITDLAVGMHSFTVYFTVDGIESNILNYYIIYNNDNTRQAPIIALAAENSTITYGDDLKINYTVATIGAEKTDSVYLELYAMEEGSKVVYANQTFVKVENEQVKDWRPVDYPESGTAYIKAIATHTVNGTDYTDTKTIEITINELELPSGYTIEPAGEANLVYSYNAYGRTNNDAGKEIYHYDYKALTGETIQWTGNFNGFNWSGDGYKDGALVISGGATHTVDVPIFQNMYNDITLENNEGVTNISKLGRTVEIEYEVTSATDLNDVIINYMDNISTTTNNGVTQKSGVGFQVTPQSCYLLKSGSTINTDSTGFIINESDIAAAYLTPGMRIHLAFVIEPWADTLAYDQSYHQSVNIYVNGEFANACPYTQGIDSFASSATLRIGSSSCIIKLYQIKMYNRGLTHKEILQNYKVAPPATRDKLTRLYDNDILNADGQVDYEKARTKYTCLLLTGPAPIQQDGIVINPTVSPYKGYPSPAGRKDKKTNETVGKTESGVTLTKANPNVSEGYDVEFDLRDTVPTDQSIEIPTYIGARGAYVSSNNVQGTSSQKYPVHNLKVYLAKWQGPKTTTKEVALEEGEDTTGLEIVEHDGIQYKVVTETTPAEIKKVKYSLKGKDEHGEDIGVAESTLCWKADYMSTDHANTYNANIADGLFSDVLPGASWGSKHQNTVYGIRCLLFQKQGDAAPEFLGDGCLNNDKGNNKTYDLERSGDEDADTASQKWEFTNNSDDLGYFKTDTIFKPIGDEDGETHIQALDAFESTYPDQGDLEDAGLEPNYNHLQIVLTWLSKRANYWDASTTAGTGGTYNGTSYSTERELKKAIFKREFTNHFNMNHALTYYIFSEYIALCDNRVKNMFLRSDNVRSEIIKNTNGDTILEGNNEPGALWSNYVNTSTGITNVNYIDWENSTFAIWAPVLYDLDSCFGVENVGYIRVRYDATWDYTWNGAPQFNGYESRLWLQFADSFDTEIRAAAPSLYNRSDGLNYSNFYRQQVVDNLNNISPALSNQDMLIKFDKPWSEGFMNYGNVPPSYETPYYKYLQRGSRTAQKTAFINMRSKLLASKYGAQEFTNDAIKFRTGVPVGASGNIIGYENAAHEVVPVQDEQHTIPVYGNGDLTETKITVKSNQTLYPGVAYGDNKPVTRTLTNNGKISAGESCDIYATSAVQGNDGIFICGASALTDIGDISKFRPYQIDIGAGINLKRLIVGSNAQGYVNNNTDTFSNLYKCALLEEINVQNCSNVATLDLSNNPLIKKVYAAGSGATTVIFPNGGVLDTVEYSAVTGNITILNQQNLTNFSYENSEINNYGALRKLWIENTPNVPVVDIIIKRMGYLTDGVRLINIDIDLGNDPTFLQTITSTLAEGKYLDSTGSLNITKTPDISGRVHINEIRASLLDKIHTMYPDLIIYNVIDGSGNISNNIISEYTVEYQNYDGTVLYTDNRTNTENYIDPVFDTNPITGEPYIEMPTKPADAQYKYRFGTYNKTTKKYVRYSGWVRQGTNTNPNSSQTVNGNTVFIAVYPTVEIQKYIVTWYDKYNGTARQEIEVDYGTDLSGELSPIEKGTLSRTDLSGNQVKVFIGWSRPLGKITEDTNVYALWQTSTINEDTQDIDMSILNAADLYALSLIGNVKKAELLSDKLGTPIYISMGQDFDYQEGADVIDLLGTTSEFTFDGSTDDIRVYNGTGGRSDIRPLMTNSDWTLAIDYKFLMDNIDSFASSPEFVLVSCYRNANSTINGFKLALVRNNSNIPTIEVTWGTQSCTIDYAVVDPEANRYFTSYRNMVVLSHNTDRPNVLRISYVKPDDNNTYAPSGANYGKFVSNTELTYSTNGIDAPLILGGNYAGSTNNYEESSSTRAPAQGIIYWAKYWKTDLGETNCSKLAAWPHETVPFYLTGFNGTNAESNKNEQIYANSELSFVAAQGMGDRYLYASSAVPTDYTNGPFGWQYSEARSICNNVIYQGIPEAYKSIIKLTSVLSTYHDPETDAGASQTIETQDYLFLPAYREVASGATALDTYGNEVRTQWLSPWSWMIPASLQVLELVQGQTSTIEYKSASSINIYRYRFLGAYIKNTAKIFNIPEDPTSRTLRIQRQGQQGETAIINSGDIWLKNGIAYMYFTDDEIATGITVDELVNNQTYNGGWKRCDMWNLRTYSVNVMAITVENVFLRILTDGSIDTAPSRTQFREYGRLLCPEFTI